MNDIITNTDSYKPSHWQVLPKSATHTSTYIEARYGPWEDMLWFGFQMLLKEYFTKPFGLSDVDEAEELLVPHGAPFNREGWMHILNKHGGYLPIEIEAAPEGMVLPLSNVLAQFVNTDPMVPWLPGYLETPSVRGAWYPTSVATLSYQIKKQMYMRLLKTSDIPETAIQFMLHDFGARGASSKESAGIGGAGHIVNFMGTDTLEALKYVRKYYSMINAAYSIAAAEHSTMTYEGPRKEFEIADRYLDHYLKPEKMVAVVSDSYDIWNMVDNYWCDPVRVRRIKESGGKAIVRPDSGVPWEVAPEVVRRLAAAYGTTTNSKGYDVLHPCIGVIQGDGVNYESIGTVQDAVVDLGLSAENIAFGMGGALLQGPNRDLLGFAEKANANKRNGLWHDQYKIAPGKNSKRGQLALVKRGGKIMTIPKHEARYGENLLRPVFRDGKLLYSYNFEEIRERAHKHFIESFEMQEAA